MDGWTDVIIVARTEPVRLKFNYGITSAPRSTFLNHGKVTPPPYHTDTNILKL